MGAALACLILVGVTPFRLAAQQNVPAPEGQQLVAIPLPDPSDVALPLAEDRGQAALEQSLKRLSTTASVLMIVAHPDDEDGGLLTYLSRGIGARATLLTLTRGEGGQNAISADAYDALGLIRTNELLKADEYYGAKQLWGTEVDFGFSKTQEESFVKWSHERVLYDAVLAATMLLEFAVALLGKLSPQLPVMMLTVPMKTLTGFVMLAGALAVWPRFIEARFSGLLDLAERLIAAPGQTAGLVSVLGWGG